jgi:tetratricopeptide (TPR) repeat protein
MKTKRSLEFWWLKALVLAVAGATAPGPANAQTEVGVPPDVRDQLTRIELRQPGWGEATRAAAGRMLVTGDVVGASVLLRALSAAPETKLDQSESWRMLGEAQLAMGHPDEAASSFVRQLEALDADSEVAPYAGLLRASGTMQLCASLVAVGRLEEAASRASEFGRAIPSGADRATIVSIMLNHASTLQKLRREPEAAAVLGRALSDYAEQLPDAGRRMRLRLARVDLLRSGVAPCDLVAELLVVWNETGDAHAADRSDLALQIIHEADVAQLHDVALEVAEEAVVMTDKAIDSAESVAGRSSKGSAELSRLRSARVALLETLATADPRLAPHAAMLALLRLTELAAPGVEADSVQMRLQSVIEKVGD